MRRALLALLVLAALPLPAAAGKEGRVRLVAPASGAELTADAIATVEWQEVSLPAGVEEWEAFLSVDGGRTWPVRITPHLDLSIRRFAFRVPDLPTRDARLLLRFGDERQEIEVETPQRFAIEPKHRSLWEPQMDLSLARGERPRPGAEGVAVWVEGSRSGEGLREVRALDPGSSFRDARSTGLLVLPFAVPPSKRAQLQAPSLSAVPADLPVAVVQTDPLEAPAAPVPVRLLIRRFNE
jgi:hypothetical protein